MLYAGVEIGLGENGRLRVLRKFWSLRRNKRGEDGSRTVNWKWVARKGGSGGRPGSGLLVGVGLLLPPIDSHGNGGGGFTAPRWVGCRYQTQAPHGVHRPPCTPGALGWALCPGWLMALVGSPRQPSFAVGQHALSRCCGAGSPKLTPLCVSCGVFLQALGKLPESS